MPSWIAKSFRHKPNDLQSSDMNTSQPLKPIFGEAGRFLLITAVQPRVLPMFLLLNPSAKNGEMGMGLDCL